MKVLVKYHNKPHGVRLYNVHLAPVCRGVWLLHAEMSRKEGCPGQEINSWGSDGDGSESVYFGDETGERPEIRSQLKLVPERPFERYPRLVDRIRKNTYEGVVVAQGLWSDSWSQYLVAREIRVRRENKLRRKESHHGS
jgi:hypothetical protein